MTSLVRISNMTLRMYPGISKKLISNNLKQLQPVSARSISHTSVRLSEDEDDKVKSRTVSLYGFADIKNKEKNTYLDVLRMYTDRNVHRQGHVEFIYAAMKYMEEFGVHKDLDVYKSLLNVLPKGKLIPRNALQAAFMHYPKQQQCAIDLLEKMENNGVIPDREMQDILLNTFGNNAHPLRKYWRMMYWMPKFKNASPWPLPENLPDESLELAKLAIKRITSIDVRTRVKVFQSEDLPDSVDKTWIVSGMSPDQEELLKKHPPNVSIYVEGPFRIWLKEVTLNYFILRADPIERPKPAPVDDDDVKNIKLPFWDLTPAIVDNQRTIHEQEDGTIFACCATGTSTRDSLLSWIRHLEKTNEALSKIPVLFTFKSPISAVALTKDNKSDNCQEDAEIKNQIKDQ